MAQNVEVSGKCINNSISLSSAGNVGGKPAYSGTGTVDGNPGVSVAIFWMGAPDNLWVLAFDGQPYFQNNCNTTDPPRTSFTNCPWTAVAGTVCDGGAALSITGSGTLPVKLTAFTAEKNRGSVLLKWTTSQEVNHAGFDVERSKNGLEWESIAFVKASGNAAGASYQQRDVPPFAGEIYYRLAQKDDNGRITYSEIVRINFTKSSFYTLLKNSTSIYQITVLEPGVDMIVIDPAGRTVIRKQLMEGNHQIDLSMFSKGVFFLQLKLDDILINEKLVNQ